MVEFKVRKYNQLEETVPIIDGKMVEMGEGHPDIGRAICPIHGMQWSIYGYTQGGHDGAAVCLKCCHEIFEHIKKTGDPKNNEIIESEEFDRKYLDYGDTE